MQLDAVGASAVRFATPAATAAVRVDPYLETAHRRLMAANAAGGDRAAALLAYRHCREVLADELGLAPSAETEAAHRSVFAAATPVAPVGLPASLDTSLPIAGRATPLSTLDAAWGETLGGAGAVVAIVGTAGVGKSRLAAEAAVNAHRAGATVVHGRFDPDDLGAFGAFGEVFGQLGLA